MASQVVLDSIALDIDPNNYVMIGGRKRGSVHRIIDGSTVYQDRGISASDLTIQISGVLTSLTTLQALYAIYRKTSHSFTLTDFKGNVFTVIFTPGAESFTAKPIYGSNIAYTYALQLSVVSITTWLGGAFPATT